MPNVLASPTLTLAQTYSQSVVQWLSFSILYSISVLDFPSPLLKNALLCELRGENVV